MKRRGVPARHLERIRNTTLEDDLDARLKSLPTQHSCRVLVAILLTDEVLL
jgi:hypothetical protein